MLSTSHILAVLVQRYGVLLVLETNSSLRTLKCFCNTNPVLHDDSSSASSFPFLQTARDFADDYCWAPFRPFHNLASAVPLICGLDIGSAMSINCCQSSHPLARLLSLKEVDELWPFEICPLNEFDELWPFELLSFSSSLSSSIVPSLGLL